MRLVGWHTDGMTVTANYREPPAPVFLFDLDGTLIDSVYQHVIAWRGALRRLDIDLSVWRIHRRIGMSGGLFVSALLRETGRTLSGADIVMLQQAHQQEYLAQADSVRPLPGAAELLAELTGRGVQWAIATSGYRATAGHALGLLGLPQDPPPLTPAPFPPPTPPPPLPCWPGPPNWASGTGPVGGPRPPGPASGTDPGRGGRALRQ